MAGLKGIGDMHSKQSVIEDIAVVLFLSSTLFALSEMSGIFTSSVFFLGYPFSSIIPTLMVFFSILGFLGIFTSSKMNIIIAVFAIGLELAIQFISFFTNPSVQLFLPSTILIIILIFTIIFGILTIYQLQYGQEEINSGFTLQKESENAIEVNNLSKHYDLGEGLKVFALQKVNFQIKKGDFVAIMGPSGSGKSTLLNCLGALDRPTNGEIIIDGISISSLDDEGLAWLRNRKIGFIFQSYNLISRSRVGENVEVPALVTSLTTEKRKHKAKQLLESVGLSDKYNRNPKTLSGGEQQRVAIARALMNDPTILLADEPTGNLDSKSGAIVMDILQKLNQNLGVTVIVVTHDPEVGNLSQRIYYLRDGTNAGIKENIII
ncbi:MAG: ABC transporter ATP-binding protein [Candidatus Hodarchaeales archaeon]